MIVFARVLVVAALASVALAGCGGGGDGSPPTNAGPPNPFAGNYSGTYTGMEAGTWTAVFGTDGEVSATIHSPALGTFSGSGTITSTGALSLTTTGSGAAAGVTITWQGSFQTQGAVTSGTGTWQSSDGLSGTWSGQKN